MSLYDVKLGKLKLDPTCFPPAVDITVIADNNTDKTRQMVLYIELSAETNESFVYWLPVSPPPKRSNIIKRLVLDELTFLSWIEQRRNSDPLRLNVRLALQTEIGGWIANYAEVVDITKSEWILLQHPNSKPAAQGIPPSSLHPWRAEAKIESVKEAIFNDPMFKLLSKIFQSQVGEIKKYLLEQPEMRELLMFPPAIEITKTMKVDARWAVGAAVLSSSEGYVKKWLINHAGETVESLKKAEFNTLIEKMRSQFKKDSITINQTIFSNMAGQRNFRNLVLHEMYEPTETELTDITKQTTDFVKYIESLKPVP